MQQFLAALDGKGGDDQIAAARQGSIDLVLQRSPALHQRVVLALAAAIG